MLEGARAFEMELPPQRLADDEVQIWQLDVLPAGLNVDAVTALLEPAERARADALRRPADREQYVVTRGILRMLVEAYGVAPAAEVRFEYSRQGKPRLSERHAACPLQFNVSHTHGRSVLAFAQNEPLGVDVERCIDLRDRDELAASCFSASELSQYQSLAPTSRLQGFYNGWTRKEAFIKATGEGLSRRLDSFSVVVTPGREPRVLDVDGSSSEAAAWTLYDPLHDGSGRRFALALAVRSRSMRIIHRRFEVGTSTSHRTE